MNFIRQGFRKLSSDRQTYIHRLQTDRHTDRQTSTEIIQHAALRVLKKTGVFVRNPIKIQEFVNAVRRVGRYVYFIYNICILFILFIYLVLFSFTFILTMSSSTSSKNLVI